MKYIEWYLAGMYDRLEQGGKQDDIEAVVREVNAPSNDGLKAYCQTQTNRAPCGFCGTVYDISNAALNQEMLCPSCSTTKNP